LNIAQESAIPCHSNRTHLNKARPKINSRSELFLVKVSFLSDGSSAFAVFISGMECPVTPSSCKSLNSGSAPFALAMVSRAIATALKCEKWLI